MQDVSEVRSEVKQLEEFTMLMNVAESCTELKNHGITQSGNYPIDPDGRNIHRWVLSTF